MYFEKTLKAAAYVVLLDDVGEFLSKLAKVGCARHQS